MKDVSIIGSGIAGIATSIRLASKGYKVKVFEHNNYPGGKINSIELDGYKFNYGPQLLTLPNLIDELYKCAGFDPKRYFKYKRKDIHCVYFWKDGTVFTAYDDKERYLKECLFEYDYFNTAKIVAYDDNEDILSMYRQNEIECYRP